MLHRNFIVFLNYLAGLFMIEVELSLALYLTSSSYSMQSTSPVLTLFASNTILNQESSQQLRRRCGVQLDFIVQPCLHRRSVVEFESLSEELETRRLYPIEAGRLALPIKVIKSHPEEVVRPQLFFVRHSNLKHNEAQRIAYRPGLR
jgi:hypothetical protein